MNLADLLQRKDRAVELASGAAEPMDIKQPGRTRRAVRLEVGARIFLNGADEFSVLKPYPQDINWVLLPQDGARGGLNVSLQMDDRKSPATLFKAPAGSKRDEVRVTLDWPIAAAKGYRLQLEQTGDSPTILGIGWRFDPRAQVRALAKGRGVEVGPGLNPIIRPGSGVHVEYVEEMPPELWKDVYGKGKPAANTLTDDIIKHYRVGSAVQLNEWAPDSLDFIFSNHVFEHLMNPLQVLSNWMTRLKPGGAIVGATPDARYTFDLRQPFSTASDFREDFQRGGFDVTEEKYLRWCRYTAPYNTPEDLRRRKYSIHVHYYTPEVFRILSDELTRLDHKHSIFIDAAPNNKDFGFALIKQ